MNKVRSYVLALAVLALLPCSSFAAQQETVSRTVTTENMGTISEFSPDTIVVRSQTSSSPTTYSYTKSTTYVDEMGNPVSMEAVKSGMPVTVYYTNQDGRMVADKVMVRKTTTTTGNSGTVETRKTTTTTTN